MMMILKAVTVVMKAKKEEYLYFIVPEFISALLTKIN